MEATAAESSKSTRQTKSARSKGKAKASDDGKSQPASSSQKGGPKPTQSTKLRGMDRDSPEVRISKTLSWLLRHGAQSEGLPMRTDGYVKVQDLLAHQKLKATGLDLEGIKNVVRADSKQRYDLILENSEGRKLDSVLVEPVAKPANQSESAPLKDAIWWIKARQGHSIKTVQLDLTPITSNKDIPTGTAVHGTNKTAWEAISKQGLSKMKRNHIHLAQGAAGQNVVSGMRTSSQVLIYIDVQKALESGIKFWLSDNGVVLTEGDQSGYLPRKYFEKVVDIRGGELNGWEEI